MLSISRPTLAARTSVALTAALMLTLSTAACGDDTSSASSDATAVDSGDATNTTSSSSSTTTTDGGGGADTGLPDRDADVSGVVAMRTDTSDVPDTPALVEPSDDYYDGMSLLMGEPVVVDATTGDPMDVGELHDGDRVEVWVEGGCRESYPVQCGIAALRVTRRP